VEHFRSAFSIESIGDILIGYISSGLDASNGNLGISVISDTGQVTVGAVNGSEINEKRLENFLNDKLSSGPQSVTTINK
jgi:hypothetical protein